MQQDIINNTNVRIELYISADSLDFNYITSYLAVFPTEIQKKEVIQCKEFAKDHWCYGTACEESDNIGDQLYDIYNVFSNKKSQLKKIITKFNAIIGVNIIINIYNDEFPLLVIPSEIIKFLGNIPAEIDFSILML